MSELVRIDLADWDRREDAITLRKTKNTDPHTLFLHPGTKALLVDWLEVRGTEPGKLFCSSPRPSTGALNPERHPVHAHHPLRARRHRRASVPTTSAAPSPPRCCAATTRPWSASC